MDHKNLEYLCMSKRLNVRQARWTLFFADFSFTLHYRSGSKNTNNDALSRCYCSESSPDKPKTILTPACFINAFTWEIDEFIANSSLASIPEDHSLDLTFSLSPLGARLITWAHRVSDMGHPNAPMSSSTRNIGGPICHLRLPSSFHPAPVVRCPRHPAHFQRAS